MTPAVARDDRGGRGSVRGRGRGRSGGRGIWMDDETYDMDISTDDDAGQSKKDVETKEPVGRVAKQVNLLVLPQHGGVISPMAEQEKKRPRRAEKREEEVQQNQTARSALSFEEGDRAQ